MERLLRLALAICAPLILTGCLVTPGKFTSTLDIRADRSFTFTYQGEVLALDSDDVTTTTGDDDKKPGSAAPAQKKKDNSAEMQTIADALTREQGYRSVKYVGDNVFMIDYRIAGRLDHGFIYPFNLDASMIVPFIAIELRGPDRVRIKASGYANSNDSVAALGMPGMPGGASPDADKAAQRLDGHFTLTTDAEIVSQNQEEGVTIVPGGKAVNWRVTAKTATPPMAVLKLKPLP